MMVLGILHVCGDDPKTDWLLAIVCSVFSAYVEMTPTSKGFMDQLTDILHICGDDPFSRIDLAIND